MMQFPYGMSFNCYFFVYNTWFAVNNPAQDGTLSPDEALQLSLVLVNQIVTNVLFNMGFMYNDVVKSLTMLPSTPNYWQVLGLYAGDFFIRFFYRRSFLSTFEY